MYIQIEELKKICLDFFRLTGMSFSLWDENKQNVFSYPEQMLPFCEAVRECKGLYSGCIASDRMGLAEVERTRKPFMYKCHIGLIEAVVPVIEGDELIGYIMLGQTGGNEQISEIRKKVESMQIAPEAKDRILRELDTVNTSSVERISYCMNILGVLIDYMSMSCVIGKTGESVYLKAKKYVADNISQALLPSDISRHIGVSVNTLYKAVKKSSGISPTVFIRRAKISEAKKLLEHTSMSVCEVAEAVGILDVNYFIRIFGKETGQPPLRYRKTAERKQRADK